MSLKDRITEDMKSAMRMKESDRLVTIRMLLAACKQVEVDERKTLTDEVIVRILDKLIKQRKDSVDAYLKGGRDDLANKELFEIGVLQAYLPVRLSEQEIETVIREIVAEIKPNGLADLGIVMGAAKSRLTGKADMSKVSSIVKGVLAA